MANFSPFFKRLVKDEGGYVNNSKDKGGPTKWGVTLSVWIRRGYDKNNDNKIDIEDVKLLNQSDAITIAKPYYWDEMKADEIKSQSVAELLVDFAYNSGVGTAARKIQELVGVKADGVIGKKSIAAINKEHPKELFDKLRSSRIRYVSNIVLNHPTQRVFYRGWISRINSFQFKS